MFSSRTSSVGLLKSEESGNQSDKGQNLQQALQDAGLVLVEDNTVDFDKNSRQHPRNWDWKPKIYTIVIVSWLELYMTGISSAGTATADDAYLEYGVSRTIGYFAFTTIYLLGQTVGGIFLSPVSESFGRRTIYLFAAALYCIMSVITAAVPSIIAAFIPRFFAGVAAAAPATVAFGNFADMYDETHRIWVVYFYTLAGFIGLAMGPIFSAYISATINWRWVYYISAIVSGISFFLCFWIKESNADRLVEEKLKRLRRETGNRHLVSRSSKEDNMTFMSFAQDALFRPLTFLVTEPIVLFCAVLCAIAFGLIYGLTEGLTIVYTASPFNFSTTSASLSFIAVIIGELINIFPRFYDYHILRKYKRIGRPIKPEDKIMSFAIACPALAIGLWLFAWTIPPRVTNVPWPISMIGLILIGFALNDFSYVLFGYVTDCYGPRAASGVAAISLARTLAASVFPLFTYQMFTGLGSNIAASILAAVATVFAFTPILFLGYGNRLRQRSNEALSDEQFEEETEKS